MKTTTRKKIDRPAQPLDLFLSCQVRFRSLDHARSEIIRCRTDGEEILAQMAEVKSTGNVYRDAVIQAGWETRLEAAIDAYNAAFRKLCWELEDANIV